MDELLRMLAGGERRRGRALSCWIEGHVTMARSARKKPRARGFEARRRPWQEAWRRSPGARGEGERRRGGHEHEEHRGARWTELAGSRAVDEVGREASGARMDELLDEERLDKKSTQEEESERRKRRGWRRWWERPNEEGIDQERVSLGPRVSSVRWAWGRPSREEGSAGLAGLGSPSPLFLL